MLVTEIQDINEQSLSTSMNSNGDIFFLSCV